MPQPTKILLVEDDPNLGFLLQENLESHDYTVKLCTDGVQGKEAFFAEQWDLCLFDVMLPKKDGFTLALEIREKNQHIPIIFLTAKSLKEDRIEGLKIGADDYICKPFSMEELLLRIQAILRRSSTTAATVNSGVYQLGIFTFHVDEQRLHSETTSHKLTTKESQLLHLLCKNRNAVLSREDALLTIWGEENYFTGRSMDVFISRLRKYLQPDENVEIRTVHGTGFRLVVR
ncbi:MAG: response regulator transcription factor [Deferribacteres bacterium]|nr:response regulator transcription factor [candidate division KSB1 bacterium]MCB9502724.1 response regulator transcription factor [Deferribacteres bacterium]